MRDELPPQPLGEQTPPPPDALVTTCSATMSHGKISGRKSGGQAQILTMHKSLGQPPVMPTTRLQSANVTTYQAAGTKRKSRTSKTATPAKGKAREGSKRATGKKVKGGESAGTRERKPEKVEEVKDEKEQVETEIRAGSPGADAEEPPMKRRRRTGPRRKEYEVAYQEGVIERGHIYFFFRPKVQVEEAESLDDVRNFQMLLVPRPPEWLASVKPSVQKAAEGTAEKTEEVQPEMKVLSLGAEIAPSPEPKDTTKKHYRVVTVGKKHLPTEELVAVTSGRKRPVFWATITSVGEDLEDLEGVMGEKTYETKTRGTRHNAPARLAARGVYAIVNRESPRVPSQRESHFVYRISHPTPESFGDVQHALGIVDVAAFILQVKNPLAPAMGPQQVRTSGKAEYREELMRAVFGTATGGKGRHDYGLRFASCETSELLDHKGAQLLFIATKEGQEGLEDSIGEERGRAMEEANEKEGMEIVGDIFKELGFDMEKFPAEPLKGEWI